MATITKRLTKGSELTELEVDTNWNNLNADKLEHLLQDSAGGTTAYTLAHSPTVTSLVTGQVYRALINATNDGASTMNIDSTGAIAIQTIDGTALLGGEMVVNHMAELLYDGTVFKLLNPYHGESSPPAHNKAGTYGYHYNDDGADEFPVMGILRNASGTGLIETDGAWESFGPTGSGATNEQSALDDQPDNATMWLGLFRFTVQASIASHFIELNGRPEGSGLAFGGSRTVLYNLQLDGRTTTEGEYGCQFEVTLNPTNLLFDLTMSVIGEAANGVVATVSHRGWR